MACRVVWSPAAIADVDSIAGFIARDSLFYAQAVATKIMAVGRGLCDQPCLGRKVPELDDPAVRERLVYSYRLIYRVDAERILVLAVIHGKRQMESLANDFNG